MIYKITIQPKPKKRKLKKYILKTITAIMAVICMLSICAVDSESLIPLIAFGISFGWLSLFAWANGYTE